jgi:hypothetical protein
LSCAALIAACPYLGTYSFRRQHLFSSRHARALFHLARAYRLKDSLGLAIRLLVQIVVSFRLSMYSLNDFPKKIASGKITGNVEFYFLNMMT